MSFSPNYFASRRRARASFSRLRRERAKRQPRLEGLEDRVVLTTDVWTGAAANTAMDLSWSNSNNWSEGVPQTGQDLVFPVAGPSTFIPSHAINNDLSGMSFDSIEIDAPGYSLTGNPITVTGNAGIFTTYTSGVSTFGINTNLSSGNVSIAAGGELDINASTSGSNGLIQTGGGTLGGNGPITTLSAEAGTVQPGVSGVGNLSVQGSTTLSDTSTFATSISSSGVSGALVSFGTPGVTLQSPDLDLSIAPGFTPAPGTSFTIIQGKVSGSFNNLPAGGTTTFGGITFRASYGNTGAVLTVVEPTSVQTSLQSGTSPSVFGQSLTFAATVSAAAGTPGGTVTFEDGATVLDTAPVNSSGVATFTTPGLALGQHSITSVYSGNGDFAASTSSPLLQNVDQSSSTTTLTSSANPSSTGQNVTFTAKVSPVAPGGGIPTGSVTFSNGTTQLAVVPLQAGSASYSTSALTLGTYSISAVYTGDTNFIGGSSNTLVQNVNTDGSVTSLDSSANPSVIGQTVTFTATVSAAIAGSGTPTGSVSFFDGTNNLGTVALNGDVATLSTSHLTRGGHTISAVYSGDSGFGTSTSAPVQQNVNQAATQTIVIPSPTAIILGTSVTLTAVVTPISPGGGVPTGSVTFLDGTTELETEPLNAGTASFSTSSLTLGSHSITAYYPGDGNDYLASVSAPAIDLVGATKVALASSENPSTFGESVAFTATVSADAPGSSVPVGSVTFMDGTRSLGTFTLDASGVASTPMENLAGGPHTITAAYSGSAGFAAGSSTELDQLVNPATTSTALTPSAATDTFGETETLRANVTSAAGSPTGSVAFMDGSKTLATMPLDSSGVATYSASNLTIGAHNLVAVYTTDSGNFASSTSSSLALSVDQASTTTILTSSTATPVPGQLEIFTATVAPVSPGAGSPTGSVVFHDGSTVIGTAPITSGGAASITVTLSGAGQAHVIEAAYDGSTGYASSDSASQTVTVAQGTPTVTLIATPVFRRKKARAATLEVIVQPTASGAPVPTGTVTFEINNHKLRTVTLVNGSASVTVASAKATGKNFVVNYVGNTSYKAAVSSKLHIGAKFFKAKPK